MKSISRWQLRSREVLWEGSLRQSHEAMYKYRGFGRQRSEQHVIKGLASGASEPSIAKPSGLGRRVNDAFAWWKLMFLSGEVSRFSVPPVAGSAYVGNNLGRREKSAEGIVVV